MTLISSQTQNITPDVINVDVQRLGSIKSMKSPKAQLEKVSKEFEAMTGRKYELIEKYMMDDAEIAIVVLNSTAGTAKFVVNALREKGIKAGLVKPRVFRPFPGEEIADALKNCKAVAVMDKADSLNAAGGPLFEEVASAMFVNKVTAPSLINYIYGLGGKDVKADDIEVVYNRLNEIATTGNIGEVYNYLNI
jgi:pyruvate ferredoxin oxidoreductase alpha subunit